jgi:predicted alpha/beta superfamily hydrolase
MKIISTLCAIIVLATLAACGGSSYNSTIAANSSTTNTSSSSSSSAPYHYVGTVQSDLSITSTITGITYPYHVYLPHNYDLSAKNYPVIYGTDAQWIFPHFSQTIDAKNKDVIFIGIEEGPLKSNRRAIDFLPAGAPNYINFLKSEFIPLIEKNYRTTHERTYVGTSYGGLLGSILLTKEPVDEPYFKHYMLFDGSFWALQTTNIQDEELRFNASKKLNITLILTSANPGNVTDVNTYQSRYENRLYEGLTIYRRSYQVPHNDVANPSFDETIDLVY